MIQRRQTLFLLQSVFLSIALLFVPIYSASISSGTISICLVPIHEIEPISTMGHQVAIALNFLNLILASVIVFLYKRRQLQVKLSYVLLVLWLVLAGITAFFPFVENSASIISISNTFFGPIISVVGALAAFLAIRFINKDIDLLKSADRIR